MQLLSESRHMDIKFFNCSIFKTQNPNQFSVFHTPLVFIILVTHAWTDRKIDRTAKQ